MDVRHVPEHAGYAWWVDKTIEEGSELNKAMLKARRFGMQAEDPFTGIKYDNRQDILGEVEDLRYALDQLELHLRAEYG